MNASIRFFRVAAALVCGLLLAVPAVADDAFHHELEVRLEPGEHGITVEDRLTVPPGRLAAAGEDLRFVLHAELEVTLAGEGYALEPVAGEPDWTRYGINHDGPEAGSAPLREYRLRAEVEASATPPAVVLRYRGKIHHPLVQESEEYARSFSRTPGTIEEQGVVLSGSTSWLPDFGNALMTFRLAVDLPEGWDAVSQGQRTDQAIEGGRRRVVWESPEPMDEVYLVAAQFTEYSRPAGTVTAYAFLREPDTALAAKYLEATVQYIEMYRQLIGRYPYGKFALVENFWDTGYGMPSFTLLGPRIIRFPFILHSSYPHEILHNWWGNSVFVDYESGNWCEGLTAYLADHLIKEGRKQGVAYRRDTLKKYRNFVRGEKDFPLTAFRSRHSSATEAVGYGKSLMLWHMVRRQIGDEAFADGLRRAYRSNRFKRATFEDFERAFEEASGAELGPFFEQWVERTGAPELELKTATRASAGGETLLSIELRQVQAAPAYRLTVPVAVTLEGEPEARLHTIEMSGPVSSLELSLPAVPLRVDVDPEFDLFRRLDPLESPPSLGQLFGAERVTLVLPKAGGPIAADAWRAFAETWAEGEDEVQVVEENDLAALPADRAVWVLGEGNRWAGEITRALEQRGAAIDGRTIHSAEGELPREGHSFAVAIRHPQDPELALGWVDAGTAAALPGLARKLPHYGKYSLVVFDGDEPTNVVKEQWSALQSPLVAFPGEPGAPRSELPAREPLARLGSVFDPERLVGHVRHLASDELEGRGVGSAGLDRASDFVAQLFERAGLTPGGDDDGWFQTWTEQDGPGGKPVTLRNVIGVLPGTNPSFEGQSVVLGAHVDHLGRGWPDVRSGDEGQLHPGADDNASGVAVLIELAELLGREHEPSRTLVFAAFSGEEWKLRGSRHYVEAMKRWPAKQATSMMNLDTVGRLGGGKIQVFGTGTATEWVHIVRGIGFTTGVEAKSIADDPGGSDQMSFVAAGVPAVQIFSGAHEDYHRPSDTADKIDAAGLVKVATFTREAIVYLTEREEPLTSTLASAGAPAAKPAAPTSGRRVSLGTLPDFAFPGPGVKIDNVMPGTPAEKAGLLPGDMILTIDGEEVADVRGYSGILRKHAPGDTIRIVIVRGDEELTIEATLVAR